MEWNPDFGEVFLLTLSLITSFHTFISCLLSLSIGGLVLFFFAVMLEFITIEFDCDNNYFVHQISKHNSL